ncbi:aromatic ring-hydroxylating oxygenase subunit alpha [Ensifer soli]|uniref:aromatic ring-hydroxylating oxygenase subunit alpha n=1 Tax=Ciceribacter sp. sgz301302 TaxID=3342379 RepID=UPI0035BADE57
MLNRPSPITALLDARVDGHALPAGLYTRADVFEADLDVLFRRHWIYIGLDCDVPEPGDATVIDIGRTSLILLRDDDGALRLVHNVCRHRGSRLLDHGPAILSRIVCPYHQWTYALDGTLAHAPHMGTGFDRSCNNLKPVHVRSIGGLVFACLSETPPDDIDRLAAVMEERLAPYGLKDARIAHQVDVIEEGNWKLTLENNRECYHCSANHPELCVSFVEIDFGYDPDTLSAEDREMARAHEALYAERTAAWEAEGFPSAPVEQLAGHATNFRTQRLIIAGAGESQTPDATAACSKLLGTMTRKDLGDIHLWAHNGWSHFMGDHAVTSMVIPLAPDRTLVRTKWLVHKDAVEGVDYDRDTLTSVWTATTEQDSALVARSQRGVEDPAYIPGPYSPFTERQLDNFATWYIERMRAHGY